MWVGMGCVGSEPGVWAGVRIWFGFRSNALGCVVVTGCVLSRGGGISECDADRTRHRHTPRVYALFSTDQLRLTNVP